MRMRYMEKRRPWVEAAPHGSPPMDRPNPKINQGEHSVLTTDVLQHYFIKPNIRSLLVKKILRKLLIQSCSYSKVILKSLTPQNCADYYTGTFFSHFSTTYV